MRNDDCSLRFSGYWSARSSASISREFGTISAVYCCQKLRSRQSLKQTNALSHRAPAFPLGYNFLRSFRRKRIVFKAVLPLCYHKAVIPLELLRRFSPVDSIASVYSCNPKSYYFPLMNRNSGIASQTLYEHTQPTINLLQSCDIRLMLRCPVMSRNAHSEIQTQFW